MTERPTMPGEDGPPVLNWLSNMVSVPIEEVSLHSIEPGPVLRDNPASAEYVQLLAQSAVPLPPIVVHRQTRQLIDGAHRLEAARSRRQNTVPVRFFDGDAADAFALAVQANVAHGLPLSPAERKAAARRLMVSHPHWSDRLIGRTTGLSHHTVCAVRKGATGQDAQLHNRVGGDGRVRPRGTAAGRRIAAGIIRDDPGASLRQVARLAGISPGTVRDVRARLRRGEDPAPDRREKATVAPAPQPGADSGDVLPIQRAVLLSLRNDPALRFTEKGRALLRAVTACSNGIEYCEREFLNSSAHCHGSLAKLARVNAQAWADLAQRLESGDGRIAGTTSNGPSNRI